MEVSAYRRNDKENLAGLTTWTTRNSMVFAVDDVNTDDFTGKMKANLSVLIANSPEEAMSMGREIAIAKSLVYGSLSHEATAEFEAGSAPHDGEDVKLASARSTLETQAYAELVNSC